MTLTNSGRAALGLLLFSTVLSTAASAGCWVEDRFSYASEEVEEAVKGSALEAAAAKAADLLKKDAVLSGMADYRQQLTIFIGYGAGENTPYTAELTVGFHPRDMWQGSCGIDQEMADYELRIRAVVGINDTSALTALDSAPEDTPLRPFTMPQVKGQNALGPIYGPRDFMVLAPKGLQLYLPYTVKQHLTEKRAMLEGLMERGDEYYAKPELAKLDAKFKKLSEAELAEQTGYSEDDGNNSIWAYDTMKAGARVPRVYMNPAIGGKDAKMNGVNFITIYVDSNVEDAAVQPMLEGWIAKADFAPLAALIK